MFLNCTRTDLLFRLSGVLGESFDGVAVGPDGTQVLTEVKGTAPQGDLHQEAVNGVQARLAISSGINRG